ncbi:MAG: response regulator [Myxococcota bacterium]
MTQRPLKILIIDDSAGDRFLIRAAFVAFQNSSFTEVETAIDAIEILDQDFDCIFLDLYLPGVKAFSLLKQIREIKPDTPLILCTGTQDMQVARDVIQAGADAYLSKILLSPDSVNRVLKRAFEASSSRKQLKWFRKEIQDLRAELSEFQEPELEE